MDFAWAINALKQGQKVTRKAWAGDPPMHLYILKGENGNKAIMMHAGTDSDFEWYPRPDQMLDITDWEEYVEPKVDGRLYTGETMTVEEYQRTHSGERWMPASRQKGPFDINTLPFIMTEQDSHGGKPVKEPELDAETNKAIALVAMNIAENLVELMQNPSVQRILQDNQPQRSSHHDI